VERISELDLEIMELALEKKEIPEDKIKAALRRICVDQAGYPVLIGSSFKRKGVQKFIGRHRGIFTFTGGCG